LPRVWPLWSRSNARTACWASNVSPSSTYSRHLWHTRVVTMNP